MNLLSIDFISGIIFTSIFAISYQCQIYKIYKTKSCKNISVPSYIMSVIGLFLVLLYVYITPSGIWNKITVSLSLIQNITILLLTQLYSDT